MKQDMTNNLDKRYQQPDIAELLNLACFVDPRFKTMPFMDEAERGQLHDSVLLEVMMHVTPDPEPEPEKEQPVPDRA